MKTKTYSVISIDAWAGDELACAHLKALIWALETEQDTGIFPKAELDSRIATLTQ